MAAVTICRDLGAPQNKGRPEFEPWVGKIPWRRKWQSTPVLSPGKSRGQRSLLVGYSLWGRKELDTTEQLHFTSSSKIKSATVSTVADMLGFSNPQKVLLFSFQIHMIFFLNIYILLKYSWLTVFQVHSKVIQLYIYTYIIFRFFSIIGTRYWL